MSAPRRRARLFTTSAFGALALAALWAAPAQAQLVQGATPAQSNGSAPTVNQAGNTTTVTLGGSRTVIDWDKFDINSGDTANFVFANRSDIVLNRVGGAGSTINGNLNGTIGSAGGTTGGNIWIYNANGVVIGANARVSTGGLLVTTAAVDRATDGSAGGFLDGTSTSFGFTGAGTGNITVQNGAQIASHGGAIALVAPVVTAEAGSSISAQDGGNVLVGSASKYQISFRQTPNDDMDLLSFEVASGADGAGTSGTDAISLAGDISGNRVFVAAVSKSGLVASVMNTGTITATTAMTDETGAIVLGANRNIVNGAAAAAPVSSTGEGYVATIGGSIAGPKVDFVASESVLLRGDVGEAGATVNLHSDNADTKQFAGVITADTLTASAQTGINFHSFDINRVDKLGALTTVSGDLTYLGDEDGVILTGAISAPGKVTLGARGFMDTTTGSISAGSLELSLGGGGSFKVDGDANLGSGQSDGAVTVHATGGITLANEFAMNHGDQLSLTADTGAIRETGGFISGGGAVVANAGDEIDLGGANSFTSLTANSSIGGGRVTVNATGNLDFKVNTFSGAHFTVGGDATSSGTNALISGGLFVTAGGAINLSADGGYTEFGDLSAGGNITLAMDGNLVLGGVIHAGGAMSLTSRGGAIRQTSGTLSLGTSFTLNAVTGIDLNQTGNHLGDAQNYVSDVTSGNGSAVRIRGDAMKLYLHGALGNVSLYGESGDIVVGPGLIASSLTAEAAGDIQIGSNGNTVAVDTYHRLIGTNVSVYNNGDFTVDGDVGRADVGRVELVAPNGTLTQAAGTIFGADISLRATYAINQDSGASVQGSNAGFEAIAGTDLLLAGANWFSSFPAFTWGANANVTIRSVGDLYVDTSNIMWLVPAHTLKLISDEGSVGAYGGFIADTLNVEAHGDIMLDDATYTVNRVGSVTGLTSATGNISLREDDGFDIHGDISAAAGNITLRSDGAIETYSGALSLGGTLAVTAGGASLTGAGAIKLGAVSTSGGSNFYLGSDGDIELTGAINTGTGTLILSTTNGAITSNGGTISAWATTADATGAITLVGSGFANFWATSTGGGDIHLSSDNDLGFSANTAGALTVETTGQASNSGDVVAHSVSITAGTGIGLINTGFTVDIGSFSHLSTDDGLISLDLQGDIKLDGDVTAGGAGNTVSLISGGSLLQNSGTITGDTIWLQGAAGITQGDAAVHGGELSLTSNTHVSLSGANDFTSLGTLNVGGNLTLRNLGTLNLDPTVSGGYTAGGALNLTSDTGDVTAGNTINTSKLTASALNGNILLGGGHQIASLGALIAGGDIEIGTANPGFNLTGDITATNLTLLALNGAITQNSGTKITAGTLIATANGNITLDQANAVTTLGGLNANVFTTGHNVTFRNAGNITLGGLVNATGGTLTLTSNTGTITQNAGASIYLLANRLSLSAGGSITLFNSGNDVATIISASSTNGDIDYRDANGYDLAGDVTVGSGHLVVLRSANSGTITQSAGIITADQFGLRNVGSATFNQANRISSLVSTIASGAVSITSTTGINITGNVTADTLSLASGGAITQDRDYGYLSVGTLNLSAVTGINLPGGAIAGLNYITGIGAVTNSTSGGILIANRTYGANTRLAGNITAAGQTVTISDTEGFINQTGGVITADTLNLSASSGINATSANAVANLGALSTGGSIAFTNAGNLTLGQSIDVIGNSLTLSSTSGSLVQGTGTTLNADSIALSAGTTISQGAGATLHALELSLTSGGATRLGEANDFTKITGLDVRGDLTLRNLGLIDLSPGLSSYSYTAGGALTLTSDMGSILSTNTGVITSRLIASAVGTINLSGTIASVGDVSASSVFLWTYHGNMALTGNITATSVSLGAEQGSLTQTGGVIDAGRLGVTTDGTISLTGANQVDLFGRLNTDKDGSGTHHDITLHNVGAIVFDQLVEAAGATVDLTSDAGGISQTSTNGSFITAGTLNANAAGDIVLDQGNDFDHLAAIRSTGGAVTLVDANAFDLTGQVRSAGALTLNSGGAITTNGGLVVAGGLLNVSATSANLVAGGDIQLGTVTTNGNFAIDTDQDLTVAGLLNTNGGDATLKANFGTIGSGASGTISANKVTAAARDSITLDSTGNAIVWASSSNGGDINLTGNADIFFKIDTAGDLTVDAGGVAGNNDSVIARSVGINADGGIVMYDQTVTINVGSYRYLTSSAGSIDIENQGDINLDGDVTASSGTGSNYVRLNSSLGSLLQNSGTISGYSVELDAAQSVSQDASAKVVAGDYGLSFRATDVSLLGANEIPSINTYTVTNDLTLRAVGTINMGGLANQAVSNHYTTLISDTGDIIGGPINAARLSATATNGKLVFNYGNNHIGSLGDLTAKNSGGTDIDIFSDSLLGLTGDIIGGGVNIYATQGISQDTGSKITADRLYTGTSGDLLLGGANNFGQLLDFGHGNGRDVTIRNLGSITLPGAANSVGTLTLTSDTGSIGQTSAIAVATLMANAATGINLTQANNFTTLTGLITATGDIRIADTNGFAIEGDITAPGTVALASGGNITTGTTVTTPHGKVDADTLTVSAANATVYTAGDIKLGASGVSGGFTLVADGSIDLTATSIFNAASLIANAGSITQSAGILTGNTVLTGAYGKITLDKNNNLTSFGGTSQHGANVTFNNVGTSTLDLTVSTTGNAVVTTAGGVSGSYIRAGDLSLTAGGAIDLRLNTDVNSVSKLASTSGSIRLTDANSFQITGDITAGTGALGTVDLRASAGGITQSDGTITGNDVHLTGTGALNQVGGARVVANTIALSGYSILFGGANSFDTNGSTVSVASLGGLTLRNAGSIDLDALGGFTSGGSLALTSDDGSITSLGAVTSTALTALAEQGSVSFGNAANTFTYLGAVSAAGDATITTNSTSFILLNNIRVGGRLTIGALGTINQSNGTITAGSLYASTNGASGAITLAGDNDIDTLGSLTAVGDVRFNDIDGFQVAGAVNGDEVWFSAAAGAIGQGSASTITAGRFIATAVDGLDFGQTNAIGTVGLLVNSGTGGINFKSSGTAYYITGDVTAAGQTVTLASSNGQIIQNNGTVNAGLLNIDSAGFVSLRGGVIDAIGTVQDNYYVSIAGITGNVALTGDIHALGFGLTASGAITQTGGTITTPDLSLSAGGGITALAANNDVDQVRLVTSGTGTIQFNTLGDLRIAHGTSNAGGLLDIRAGGKITVNQFDTVTANQLALHAGGDIAIDQYADLHIGTVKGLVSDTGDIAFYNYAGFTLDGNLSAAGTVTVRTGMGDIDQQSGIITAARLNIRTDLGDITLDKANAVDLLGDVYAGSGNFTFTNAGDLVADGSIHAPGLVTLNSGGTLRTTANGEIVGGGLIANAETGIALGRQLFGTVYGLSSTTGGITFSNNGAFDIQGDIDAGAADVSLTANGGGITGQSAGTITARTLTLNTDGDTDLTQANHVQSLGAVDTGTGYFHFGNAGDIVVNGAWTTGGDIALTSGGAITQTVAIDTTRFTASAVNGITLTDANNSIDRIGGLSNSGTGGIALSTNGDLVLDGAVGAAGQAVSLVTGGSLLQNGGTITADTFAATVSDDVNLAGSNAIGAITGLASLTNGTINLVTTHGLVFDGDVSASAFSLDFGAGTVTQRSGTITGTVSVSGDGDVTLDRANAVSNYYMDISGDATLRAVGALQIGGDAGSMTVRAGGAITQLDALYVGALDASTTSGNISLNLANHIASITGLGGSDVFVHNVTDLDIAGDVNGGTLAHFLVDGVRLTQSAGTVMAGTVTFDAGADIDQSAGKIVTASFTGTAGTGLSLAGANQIDSVALSTSSGNLLFRNQGDLDAAAFLSPGDLTLISDTGSITQSAALSIGGAASFRAAGNITLDNGGNSFLTLGLVSAGGNLDLRAADLQLTSNVTAQNVWLETGGDINQRGGIVTADSLGGIADGAVNLGSANEIGTIGALRARARAGNLTLHLAGDMNLTDAIAAAGNHVTLISDTGGITQANDPNAVIYGNLLTANAGGDILLGSANQIGALSLDVAGSATVKASGSLALTGTMQVGGDLSLTSGGQITSVSLAGGVTGTVTAHAQTGIAIVYDDDDVGAFGDLITGSGDVVLKAQDMGLAGAVSTSGAFRADATAGSVIQSADSTIRAASASGSAIGGGMLLGGNNTIGTIAGLTADGDLTFKTSGALQISGPLTAGANSAMTLTAGGDINITGADPVSGGTLNVSTTGAWANFYGTPMNPRTVSFRALGNVSAGNFQIYNAGSLDLTGTFVATMGAVIDADGQITQSNGSLTADMLTLNGYGITADQQNHVNRLQGSAYNGTAFSFTNVGNLTLIGNLGSGDVRLNIGGDFTNNAGIDTSGNISITATGGYMRELWGNKVTVNGGANDLTIGNILTSDDVSVTATGNVTVGSLYRYSNNDTAGDGYNALISGHNVTLGAPEGAISNTNTVDYSVGATPGTVTVLATGNATLGVDSMYNTAVSISAAGDVFAHSLNELMLGNVDGANVTLIAGANLTANSVAVPGIYSVTAGDIGSGTFNILGGNPLDILVTDTAGDLTLTHNLIARRNLTIDAAGDVLGGTARLGAGTAMDGTLTVNGGNIDLLEASSVYDVALNGTRTVNIGDIAYVGRNYTLTGNAFTGAALAPIGTRSGTWTLTSTSALDLGGNVLEFGGAIDLSVDGLLGNGTIHSLSGAVTARANAVDIYELLAGTDIDVSSSSGALQVFHAAADGSVALRSNQALMVTGSVEAGGDADLSAQLGAATIGYASAGGDITVHSQSGNATLRQATLTGTTSDVTVQSITGTATLGADDYASIDTDNYFERAAGATGSAQVLGATGAYVNLDHSAKVALARANNAAVNVLNGDLTIDMLQALAGTAAARLDHGSLLVNAASGNTVDLSTQGGDLILGGAGITAADLYLNSDGTIDTTALATLSASHYLFIEGGSVRAASLSSGGDAAVYGDTGGVTIDELGATGDLTVSAGGNLSITQVSISGYADLEAGGTATIRGLTASNGFQILAQGNITFGADAGQVADTGDMLVTNGTLGGCGCGGGWIASAGGDISINLFSVTGVLDRVLADTGDVGIAIGQGDLGVNTLRGHDIAVSTPGQLSIMDAQSIGGSYALTAADFGGFALSPSLLGGATSLGDVTIIDTDGDLNAWGSLNSSGNIRVEARDGAITGGLSLTAAGDVTAIGQGVALQWAQGRDITIDAGTGTADISNTLSVGRSYTVTAGDFSGNALIISGTKTGSLSITDTVGDFDFATTDLAFGGAVAIDAANGLLNIGNLQAGDAITLNAGTDLALASAKLTGTGTNGLSLTAGGNLQFGAVDAASITGGNIFSHAAPVLTGTGIHAGLDLTMNLYQADGLGGIHGGTVQITVAAGDFSAGDIDAVGALSVQGPAGTLSLGNLTTSAGHINVSGQGNTALGDVFGHFVVNLGASAGNLRVGTVTGGDVSLQAAGGIDAAGLSASTLGVVAVNGDVDLDHGGAGSQIASLGVVTVNNGGFRLRNLRDLSFDDMIAVNGTLDLGVTGALTQNAGYITADRLQGSVTGVAVLSGDNRIDALGAFSGNGLKLANAGALVIDGAVDAGSGAAVIASHGGMTISANGSVTSAAAGDAITLASDGLFTNLAGAGALSTSNGRWLVYAQTGGNPGRSDPNNDFGGLAGISYYGDAFDFGTGSFATAPNAGNRFVYGYRPVLTVTPSSVHMTYDGTTPNVTATVTGLVNGDSAANAYSGAAEISGVGSNAGTYFAYSALGTLASEMGYTFAFVPGTVIIDPRVITVVLNANDRTYDGTTAATGTLTLDGVIAGDTVTANAASMSFDSRNAGTRTVTAGGITLSGASAGNYTISATATDLADILARAITATLTANDRTYDGTTAATGSLGLNGVLGNDQVSVGGATIAFDNKNAGAGHTVTASGITLTGADAANYVVTANATDLADILARAITATLSANDRSYDGTTAATGTLSLAGVLGNDQVTANGNLTFDGRNAGTGHTVTANGITLSGADAGNYTVNASATDLADILAKAITATLTANDRTYDGTNAATGTLGLSGVVAGDAVSAGAGSIVFDSRNAGTGRTATASGITLSGADAGNYTVNASASDLADILAKEISATLTANGRVYDGTSIATGALALNGVLSGDQVTVSAGGIAFDSKNAGTRTATASGLTLGGADAANYTIGGTATASAVISQRAITAAATANSRAYDGTTGTTGNIALTGVISGDTVTGTATYRFADANAGTGRAVQVSGLGLTGADAANYTVTLANTPVTADITPRAVTVTIDNAGKILGQPDPAFGYSVTSGSVVSGDSFTGAPVREAGDQAGRYAIGQGTLALSANYLLTVIPGTLVISLTQSGAEATDVMKMLQGGVGVRFTVTQNPSRNLEGDGDQDDSEDDGD